MLKNPPARQAGFGLIVIAMLFMAFAVSVTLLVDRNQVEVPLALHQQSSEQHRRLTIALAKYAAYNGQRLPCPASYRTLPSDAAFGASYSTSCSGIGTPAATIGVAVLNDSGGKSLMGMVPVKELIPYGLALDDAFDPWGGRILYAVHRDLTDGASNAAVLAATTAQRPSVQDYITGEGVDPAPDFVLVSYGPDRIGARLRKQASTVIPSIACGTGQRRYQNCDGDRQFIRGPILSAYGAGSFDDTVTSLRFVSGP